jgi:hypothetical protein
MRLEHCPYHLEDGVKKGKRTSDMVWDGLVQLKLHAAKPVGDVDIVDALDEDGPGVGVVVGDAGGFGVCLLVKGARSGAVDEGPKYLHALHTLACWRRHVKKVAGLVKGGRVGKLFEQME